MWSRWCHLILILFFGLPLVLGREEEVSNYVGERMDPQKHNYYLIQEDEETDDFVMDVVDERMYSSSSCVKKCKKCGKCFPQCKSKCGWDQNSGDDGQRSTTQVEETPARASGIVYILPLPDNCKVEDNGDYSCVTGEPSILPFALQVLFLWLKGGLLKADGSVETSLFDCADGGNVQVDVAKTPKTYTQAERFMIVWMKGGRCMKVVVSDCSVDGVSKPCVDTFHLTGVDGKKNKCYEPLPPSQTRMMMVGGVDMEGGRSEETEEETDMDLGMRSKKKDKGKKNKGGCSKKCKKCQKCLSWCQSKCPKYKGASGPASMPPTKKMIGYYIYHEPLCHVGENGDIFCKTLPAATQPFQYRVWTTYNFEHEIKFTTERNSSACGETSAPSEIDFPKEEKVTSGGPLVYDIPGSMESKCHFLLISNCFEDPMRPGKVPTTPTPCSKWFTVTVNFFVEFDCVE